MSNEICGKRVIDFGIAVFLANLVLEHTVERIYATQDQNKIYAERPLGLFLIRGDNVALLGVMVRNCFGL